MDEPRPEPGRTLGVALAGVLGALYLLNPTAGFFELLPDNLPFIGNLDEVAATLLVLGALRHFGIDLTRAFRRRGGPPSLPPAE